MTPSYYWVASKEQYGWSILPQRKSLEKFQWVYTHMTRLGIVSKVVVFFSFSFSIGRSLRLALMWYVLVGVIHSLPLAPVMGQWQYWTISNHQWVMEPVIIHSNTELNLLGMSLYPLHCSLHVPLCLSCYTATVLSLFCDTATVLGPPLAGDLLITMCR